MKFRVRSTSGIIEEHERQFIDLESLMKFIKDDIKGPAIIDYYDNGFEIEIYDSYRE